MTVLEVELSNPLNPVPLNKIFTRMFLLVGSNGFVSNPLKFLMISTVLEAVVVHTARVAIDVETTPPKRLHEEVVPQYTGLKVKDSTMLSLFLKKRSDDIRGDNIGVRSN